MSNERPARGDLFLLSAPSGAGKTTLIRYVMEHLADSGELLFSVSHTTRRPRTGEQDGRDYHFVDEAAFRRMIGAGEFLEWAEVHGQFYGTSRQAVLPHLERGIDVVVDIDVQGAERLMRGFPRAHSVFILPPSYTELVRRLKGRGLDGEKEVARRLADALEEILRYDSYQYVIINDDVERAGRALAAVVLDKRHRRERQEPRIAGVLAGFERARGSDAPT
jgi:guanylate kinase